MKFTMNQRTTRFLFAIATMTVCFATCLTAAEREAVSPDGVLKVVVSDTGGLNYRVEVKGRTILTNSPLDLEFQDGTKLGPSAVIRKSVKAGHDGAWVNPFGDRRIVPDHYREVRLTLEERGTPAREFGLIVRAYDDGVAFRYDLPTNSGLGQFVLTNELTEFRFADDYRCWAGGESACAETQYPETRLSAIPSGQPGRPYRSVLPLLVETPAGYFAIAESDLLDWAGMSLAGTGTPAVKAVLDTRSDGNGLVVSSVPRVSPWRVLMFGRTAARPGRFGPDCHARDAEPVEGHFVDQTRRVRVGCLVDGCQSLRFQPATPQRGHARHDAVGQGIH